VNHLLTKEERRHALVGPPKLWKMKRDFQIRFLTDMALKPRHYLFEIGCGTLRGGIPLIQYLENDHYFGVEVRDEALDEGRKELREAGLEGKNPTLLLSPDISQLTVNRKFDYIWAFSVLFHLNDKILNDTLAFVSKHLSEEGVFYANVNIGEGNEGNWQGFPVVTRTLDFYSQACAMNGLVVSDLGPLKEHGHIANVESQDNQRMLKVDRR
jgi:cyclopropane fatty-acyl-phospholipid synthase-like methyltransferase